MLRTIFIIPRLTIVQECLDHQLLSLRGVCVSADILELWMAPSGTTNMSCMQQRAMLLAMEHDSDLLHSDRWICFQRR
jgi:hypothetical protein